MTFDPLVEAIRKSLRTLDASPGNPGAYLDLIQAYLNCAQKESEPELLDQATFVIRDVRKLSLTDEQSARLAALETEVRDSLLRLRPSPRP